MKSKMLKVGYSTHGQYDGTQRPKIQIEGKWLEEIGFEVGARVIVEYEKGSILIRTCTEQESAVEDEKIYRAQLQQCMQEADHLQSMIAETRKISAAGN